MLYWSLVINTGKNNLNPSHLQSLQLLNMLCSRLGSTLLMAAAYLLINTVPKCQSGNVRSVACEGSVAQLKCAQGQVISVQRAVYGRRDRTTCTTGRPAFQIRNVRCSKPANKVAERCNGKSSCSVNARNSVFGDPCRGTYKYLEVDYTCQIPKGQPGNVRSVACEGSVAQLKCAQGQVISVQRAVYGRRDRTTCTTGRRASQIRNVRCSKPSNKVAERCNGKSSCSVNARNSVFGDPCRGTYKYLEVDYNCQIPKGQPGNVRSVACEGSVAQLKCAQGQVISVQRAVYGRLDRTTCITGRPASQIKNVRCSKPANKAAERCNGKSSCSVDAKNSVFGDPCYGTYKYLEVDYTCQIPKGQPGNVRSVACEGSVAQLKCAQGQVISVQRAVYGRRDRTTCTTGRPASQIRNVRCSTPANKVAERCNGKSSCSVDARNSVFGDPCRGTYKYLEVDYTCQMRGSFSREVLICEGRLAKLKCGKNQAIHVYKEIYGRSDRTTCAYRQPAWKTRNVTCSRSSSKVTKRCNGRRACSIRASNSVFGDPCAGTYKYLRVVYTCYDHVTG
ncbi:uncharacterized protein ACNS7B_001599 [Menidia menidia]